jgi:hypothetical protein
MKEPTPQPFKSDTREKVVRYASLYLLHLGDKYIQGYSGNSLLGFLKWFDKSMYETQAEIKKRMNWDVHFKDKDVYTMTKAKARVRQAEAEVGLEGIAKFIKALVRLYWDKTNSSDNLEQFLTKFVPNITTQIAKGRKY